MILRKALTIQCLTGAKGERKQSQTSKDETKNYRFWKEMGKKIITLFGSK